MAAQKCSELVQKISVVSGNELLQCLRELHAIMNSPSCSVRDLAPHIPPDILFKCLNTSNEEQITLCKWTLKKLLPLEKSDQIVLKYANFIIEGLNHPSVEVRELCLSELERCSGQTDGLLALLSKPDLLAYTVRSLADQDLSCAQKAGNIFKNAAKHDSGLKALFGAGLQSEFGELLVKKDVVRFRVYETFVAVQALSGEAFAGCEASGVLGKLLGELDGDDVLLRMNCVELLIQLANSGECALRFLEEAGVMAKLNNILLSVDSDPLASLMIPAVIKFFGHLAQAEPDKTLQQYPQFLENVFSLISSDDPTLVPVAVETLGVLSQSDVGVRFVFNHPARNKHVMKVLYNHATSTLGSVVQLRALDALALIFQSEEQPSGDLSALVKSLYDTLGPEPLQMLMSIAKQPFEESRCAALRVMTSLARYRWAQQNMISSPGFLEYLLDRHTEPDKAGKEHKYALVVALVKSPCSAEVFDKPHLLRMREYEQEGPFYVRAQATVALEEAN